MQHEVFVIGCPRSGTTAIAQALRKIGYAGVPGEGHVLTVVPLLRKVIEDYRAAKEGRSPNDAVIQFPWGDLESGLDAFMRGFFASLYGGKLFVDKTPYDAVDYPLADIRRIWPNARILYCLRNGIDNVNSQLRKFREARLGFAGACMTWAGAVRSWFHVVESVADIAMVVEHGALLNGPVEMSQRISTFLHLDEVKSSAFTEALLSDFPELTGSGSQTLPWSDDERRLFAQICGPWMRRCGYAFESSRSPVLVLSMSPVLSSAQPFLAGSGLFQVYEREISLHPSMPGEESRLTFPALQVSHCRHFISYLAVRNALSETVRFQLEISPVAGTREKIRHEVDVHGGAARAWTVPLPPGLDVADVTLVTSMAPGAKHNQFAWAVFSNPRIV